MNIDDERPAREMRCGSNANALPQRPADFELRLLETEYHLTAARAEVDAMRTSLSWRITAPLRRLADWFGRRTGVFVAAGRSGGVWHDTAGYNEWIRRYDTLSPDDLQAIAAHIARLQWRPTLSVCTVAGAAAENDLQATVTSFLDQLYPNWELQIVHEASTSLAVRSLLDEYGKRDPRIKPLLISANRIDRSCGTALVASLSGDFLGCAEPGDIFPPHALYMAAIVLNHDPLLEVLYADEDRIDETGRRTAPFFKPDWNRELFRSQDYFGGLTLLRSATLRRLGGADDSEDLADLRRKLLKNVHASRVGHVPFVLCHRPLSARTSLRDDSAASLGLGADSQVTTTAYPEMAARPLVSLIIPTRNGKRMLARCIESIRSRTEYPQYEVIVVDNGSDEPESLAYLRQIEKYDGFRVVCFNAPFNFSALNNFGVRYASGEIVGLLNNDLEVIAGGWLTAMVCLAVQSDIGAVGAKLYYPGDRIQHAGVILGLGGVAGHSHHGFRRADAGYFGRLHHVQEVSAVTAACLLVRKDVYLSVGGLDEQNLPVAYNDIDFCLRLRDAGYRNVWTPLAELYHYESSTRGYETTSERRARFDKEHAYMVSRWGGVLLADPCYNPNLTLSRFDFSLAWPPRTHKPWREPADSSLT